MKNFVAILLALIITAPVFAQETPFRFEDYTERTAFHEAVTTRFPVGSSYLEFKRQVIAAGAEAEQNILTTPKNEYVFTKTERPSVSRMFINSWTIDVAKQDDQITAISPTFTISSKPETDE